MLVELSTGFPATDKDLFASLCQAYEQNSVATSCTASALSQNALDRAFAFSDLTSESVLPHELTAILGKNTPPKQHRVGFSIITWPHLMDGDDDDWEKFR
jgi:hypothetical protein